MSKIRIGAHVPRASAPKIVEELGLDALQVMIGSPRSWAVPRMTEKVSQPLLELSQPLYIHSTYLLNPASPNPEVRAKTRAALQEELRNASAVGAEGLIIHGGQGGAESTMDEALKRWVETLDGLEFPLPLFIENTAGGQSAPGRYLGDFSKLFEALEEGVDGLAREGSALRAPTLGYCIDTCHAWAGGFGLENLFERVVGELGIGPAVVHLNGSKDAQDGGRDHHASLIEGGPMVEASLEFAEAAGAPVIFETPRTGFRKDLEIARRRLNG